MSTYTAQNIGAGKIPRVKAGGRAGMAIGLSISAALAVLYVLLRSLLVGAFLENPVGATLEAVSYTHLVPPMSSRSRYSVQMPP